MLESATHSESRSGCQAKPEIRCQHSKGSAAGRGQAAPYGEPAAGPFHFPFRQVFSKQRQQGFPIVPQLVQAGIQGFCE